MCNNQYNQPESKWQNNYEEHHLKANNTRGNTLVLEQNRTDYTVAATTHFKHPFLKIRFCDKEKGLVFLFACSVLRNSLNSDKQVSVFFF